jgi:hypothetical protein
MVAVLDLAVEELLLQALPNSWQVVDWGSSVARFSVAERQLLSKAEPQAA